MRIEVSDAALADLEAGAAFYDRQAGGLGDYFLDTLFSDIDALQVFAGVHALYFGYHRCLSKRFPFAIYYRLSGDLVQVHAVLDCRREPTSLGRRLAADRG